jgi:C4-type Zn-finger protein
MPVIQFITENYDQILIAVAGLIASAEVIVRMTPTKKDDGFVTRIGGVIDRVMDALSVPNSKK